MTDARDPNRNPMVIPEEKPSERLRGCPYCGVHDYSGRHESGVYTFTCRACGGIWNGGIGRVPQDPTVPSPPTNPRDLPTLDFVRHHKTGQIVEVLRRPDLTQSFRRGAPIPADDEEPNDW